jgi:hypothetical protein
MNDIFLRYVQFDPDVKGVVVPLAEGDYRIYINSIYNADQQREVFNHEMRHLLLNHHRDERPVAQLEAEAAAKGALLEKIKDAEAVGLPLETAIIRPAPPAARSPAPPLVLVPAWCQREHRRLRRAALTGMYY